jgi:hypothetical protein
MTIAYRLHMPTEIGAIVTGNVQCKWINGVTRFGYILISSEPMDFVTVWALGDRVGQFMRKDPVIRAESVSFYYHRHSEEFGGLFVLPRYARDFPSVGAPYIRIESSEQPETATSDLLFQGLERLVQFLNAPPDSTE